MKTSLIFVMSLLMPLSLLYSQETQELVNQDYSIFQDGEMILYTKGMPKQLKEAYTLKNGIVLNPDGSYLLKNKRRFQLKDGECLGTDGHKYPNETVMFQKFQMKKKKALKSQKKKGKKY